MEKMTGKGMTAGRITDFPDFPILFRAGPNNRSLTVVVIIVVTNEVNSLTEHSPV